MERLRRHIIYANVVATLALVLAVGGGGVYAASKIGGKQIRKGAVRSKQIRNKNVKRQDIAGGAINSRKVSNQSLTGKDIKEHTLEIVPLAQDAHTLTGISADVVRTSLPAPSGPAAFLSFGGINATLSCGGAVADAEFRGTSPGDVGSVFDSDSGSTQEFDTGSPQTVSIGAGGATAGLVTVRRIDGTVTRLDFELRHLSNGFGSADDCFLHGLVFSGR